MPVVLITFQLVVVVDAVGNGEFRHTEGNHEGILTHREFCLRSSKDGGVEDVVFSVFLEFHHLVAYAETGETDWFDDLWQGENLVGIKVDDTIVATEADVAIGQKDGSATVKLTDIETIERVETDEFVRLQIDATQSLVARR